MNDEFIWRSQTPSYIKLCVLAGAYTSYAMAIVSILIFGLSIYHLPDALAHPCDYTITFLSSDPIVIDLGSFLKICLIVSAISCLIHFTCGYGMYKSHTIWYPMLLIAIYLFISGKFYILQTSLHSTIFLLLLMSWLLSIIGGLRFIFIKKEYIASNTPTNLDPYGLHSSYAAEDIPTRKSPFKQHIEPIKVDFYAHSEVEEDNHPRSFF